MGKATTFQKPCRYLGIHPDMGFRFRKHTNFVVKEPNRLCRLMCRVQKLYLQKRLLMIYNSFAKCVICVSCYSLSVYEKATKTKLKKNSQRRTLKAIFIRMKMDSLCDILVENKIFTVFELYILKVVNTVFNQLSCDASKHYMDVLENNLGQHPTRWNLEALFTSKYNRTVVRKTH